MLGGEPRPGPEFTATTCAVLTAAPPFGKLRSTPKDGHSWGKQTYRCRDCQHRFTPDGNRHCFTEAVKRQALDLYAEGNGITATGWVLGMPQAWVISFDEMWTYAGARRGEERREAWIWTAVVEEADGSRWGCFETGDRSEKTFSRLLERLPEALRYRSDDYVVYGLLPRNRHVPGKDGEVNRNEGPTRGCGTGCGGCKGRPKGTARARRCCGIP